MDNSNCTWVGADAVQASLFLDPIYVVFVWIMFVAINHYLYFRIFLKSENVGMHSIFFIWMVFS